MLGAIFGDIVGSVYEFHNTHDYNFKLLSKRSEVTDDTVMTLAVAKAMIESAGKSDEEIREALIDGFAIEALFEAGAVEVYTTAVGMKKSRPGTIISCMCRMDEREKMVSVMFKNTTTIGIRENICNRYVLAREIKKVETTYGEVRVKRSYGHEISREKLEYDDIAGIARRTGKSIFELREEIHEELKK